MQLANQTVCVTCCSPWLQPFLHLKHICFRLNTNVELCQSLKRLLNDPDVVAQLDPDTRSFCLSGHHCVLLFFTSFSHAFRH